MHYFTNCLLVLGIPALVISINLNLKGFLDLGSDYRYSFKTNYEVPKAVDPESVDTNKIRRKHQRKITIGLTDEPFPAHHKKPITARSDLKETIQKSDMHTQDSISRAVKEDGKINAFTLHILKQTLRLFDDFKKKSYPELSDRVDLLSKNYQDKFRVFVNDTLNQEIKTKLGSQRLILNVLDTSNRMLNRLANIFIGDMNKEGMLRTNIGVADLFQTEIDKERDIELKHVCNKLHICRSGDGFSDFLLVFLNTITLARDDQIKEAADALTVVLSDGSIDEIMDHDTTNHFYAAIDMVEQFELYSTKTMFLLAKNLVASKNQPIEAIGGLSTHVNKTIAALEILDELDKSLPRNDENVAEWHSIEVSIKDWKDGKRLDALDAWRKLFNHIVKGLNRMSSNAQDGVRDNLRIIFGNAY